MPNVLSRFSLFFYLKLNFPFSLSVFSGFSLIFMWSVCHWRKWNPEIVLCKVLREHIEPENTFCLRLGSSYTSLRRWKTTSTMETFFCRKNACHLTLLFSPLLFAVSQQGELKNWTPSVEKLDGIFFFFVQRLKLCLRATVEAVCRGRAHVLSELLPAGTRKHYLVISACWHRQLILVWITLRPALSPSFLFSE